MAADLPEEAIPAGRQAAAIVVATREVAHAVLRPAKVLRLQAAILRQDITAVDSSHPGSEPPSFHRSPSGGSERSLLSSLNTGEEMGKRISYDSYECRLNTDVAVCRPSANIAYDLVVELKYAPSSKDRVCRRDKSPCENLFSFPPF